MPLAVRALSGGCGLRVVRLHAGYRRRVLTWLLWLTGEYGHFGGKVIPFVPLSGGHQPEG